MTSDAEKKRTASDWRERQAIGNRLQKGLEVRPVTSSQQDPIQGSSVSGIPLASVGCIVIIMGIFSEVHPLGVLLKDRLVERGLARTMNRGSFSSRRLKSGTLNLTSFDALSKPPNGVATLGKCSVEFCGSSSRQSGCRLLTFRNGFGYYMSFLLKLLKLGSSGLASGLNSLGYKASNSSGSLLMASIQGD